MSLAEAIRLRERQPERYVERSMASIACHVEAMLALRARGAVVVWTFGDPKIIPPQFRTIAADAAVQLPFRLDDLRGGNTTQVGWAILLPRPAYASLSGTTGH